MNVNISGTGFTSQTTVTIDSNSCKITFVSFNLISCIVPSNVIIFNINCISKLFYQKIILKPTNANKSADVIVRDGSNIITLTDKFFYDFTNSPRVSSVSPSVLNVLGKTRKKQYFWKIKKKNYLKVVK